jgi:hypothetical protein
LSQAKQEKTKRSLCEDKDRALTLAASSQGMYRATRNIKNQRRALPQSLQREDSPANILISNF